MNYETSAVRDTAEGSKNRTIPGAIREQFCKAARAITGTAGDEPEPKRRRNKDGDSESGMMQLARQFARLFTTKQGRVPQSVHAEDMREDFRTERAAITRRNAMPDDLFGATSADWSDTLAMLNQWNDEDLAAGFDDSCLSDHRYSSLSL